MIDRIMETHPGDEFVVITRGGNKIAFSPVTWVEHDPEPVDSLGPPQIRVGGSSATGRAVELEVMSTGRVRACYLPHGSRDNVERLMADGREWVPR